jgi:hypothetical protein
MAFGLLLSLFGLNDGYIIRYSKETAQEIFVQVGLMGVGRFWYLSFIFQKISIKRSESTLSDTLLLTGEY